MDIAIVGAAGWIGNAVLQEALIRGHKVTALVRDPRKITTADVNITQFDINDTTHSLADAVSNSEVVVSALSGRHNGDHSIFSTAATRYLSQLTQTHAKRLLFVGGAGSLEVAPGVKLVSTAAFPKEYKEESLAMDEALTLFLNTSSPLNWTFISPAAELFQGEKRGVYQLGKDKLLTDDEGNSRISAADYAVALVDELERGIYPKQRIAVAY
ncbi:MAG: NAD(P)H-binding protein [Pseudomonadales bacterium]|nr:NAD(P)H-binding protein [Pseudomonadales bacterium]